MRAQNNSAKQIALMLTHGRAVNVKQKRKLIADNLSWAKTQEFHCDNNIICKKQFKKK